MLVRARPPRGSPSGGLSSSAGLTPFRVVTFCVVCASFAPGPLIRGPLRASPPTPAGEGLRPIPLVGGSSPARGAPPASLRSLPLAPSASPPPLVGALASPAPSWGPHRPPLLCRRCWRLPRSGCRVLGGVAPRPEASPLLLVGFPSPSVVVSFPRPCSGRVPAGEGLRPIPFGHSGSRRPIGGGPPFSAQARPWGGPKPYGVPLAALFGSSSRQRVAPPLCLLRLRRASLGPSRPACFGLAPSRWRYCSTGCRSAFRRCRGTSSSLRLCLFAAAAAHLFGGGLFSRRRGHFGPTPCARRDLARVATGAPPLRSWPRGAPAPSRLGSSLCSARGRRRGYGTAVAACGRWRFFRLPRPLGKSLMPRLRRGTSARPRGRPLRSALSSGPRSRRSVPQAPPFRLRYAPTPRPRFLGARSYAPPFRRRSTPLPAAWPRVRRVALRAPRRDFPRGTLRLKKRQRPTAAPFPSATRGARQHATRRATRAAFALPYACSAWSPAGVVVSPKSATPPHQGGSARPACRPQ